MSGAHQWREVTLGQVCSLRGGSGFSPKLQGRSEGDYPFIKVSDFNAPGNSITISGANNWVSAADTSQIAGSPFPAETSVFAKIGEALKQNRVRLLRRPTFIDNNLMGAVPRPEVVFPRFLFQFLRTLDFAATNAGTAVPYLTATNLNAIRLRLPPLDTQRRIASILSAYDDLIENNERRTAILEEMARRVFREWFVDFRFPGHETVRMVDAEAGRIPEGWEFTRLDDMLVLQRGFDLPVTERTPGSFPVIAASGFHGSHSVGKVKAPGVVTGRSGTLGEVLLVHNDFWPLNTTLYVKEFKRASPAFALFLLRELNLKSHGGGAAVPTLNRNDVHAVHVPCPPPDLVGRFERWSMDGLRMQEILRRQASKAAVARDALLPRLLSGETSVSVTAPLLEAAE